MSDCRKCAEFDWCVENEDCGLFKPKPQTNADRLNAMTAKEKAEWFEENATGCPPGLECYGPSANPSRQDCIKCWLNWLNRRQQNEMS